MLPILWPIASCPAEQKWRDRTQYKRRELKAANRRPANTKPRRVPGREAATDNGWGCQPPETKPTKRTKPQRGDSALAKNNAKFVELPVGSKWLRSESCAALTAARGRDDRPTQLQRLGLGLRHSAFGLRRHTNSESRSPKVAKSFPCIQPPFCYLNRALVYR
jgi:hypothetical protein